MSSAHIAETLSSATQSSEVRGRSVDIQCDSNSFVGTYVVQRKLDATTGWVTATSNDGTAYEFTDTGCDIVAEAAGRCKWRINVSAYTSGSIDVSIKRGDDTV